MTTAKVQIDTKEVRKIYYMRDVARMVAQTHDAMRPCAGIVTGAYDGDYTITTPRFGKSLVHSLGIRRAKRHGALYHTLVPTARALDIVYQIACILKWMHDRGWVYLDLKPDNVLIFRGRVKICDIDTCYHKDHSILSDYTTIGTPHFRAPEVDLCQVTPKSDIYSLGATMWELICGDDYPFISNAKNVPSIGEYSLAHRCMNQDPALRPTIDEVLDDPVFEALDINRRNKLYASING